MLRRAAVFASLGVARGLVLARRGSSTLVDAAWLQKHIDDPRLRVLDVTQRLDRETNAVAPARDAFEAAHVPGADYVDVGRDLSAPHASLHNMAPSADAFAAALGAHGVDDACHVVLYSSSKVMWATRVWWLLDAFGFAGKV
eukprot:CAMPEP_0119280502 /NCGR_PEP_ID=MMETSP1329-20130426/22774_1 /TAXON_ID=114041 /ORGANISM="Genus nov. species nov., Strain RCC1024" /LENGTH=141 /DNA_ID=CAMNT_0007281091 /DNA_START=41 /DNA_END=463 /DNA_ORIENTATION=+